MEKMPTLLSLDNVRRNNSERVNEESVYNLSKTKPDEFSTLDVGMLVCAIILHSS
jgi:hypothetical protein